MTGLRTIGVVDYGSGNLRSVSKALEAVGAAVTIVTKAAQLNSINALVVPGVGAFGDCAANLRRSGLWEPVKEWLKDERPYLGICLGYQLLFESSEESPGCNGLGILPGRVVRFSRKGLKVPHIGWNTLSETRGPLYEKLPDAPYFYFVHSYYPVPAREELTSARCIYGEAFAASVSSRNLHATQFHPEKSQSSGLTVLANFLKILHVDTQLSCSCSRLST